MNKFHIPLFLAIVATIISSCGKDVYYDTTYEINTNVIHIEDTSKTLLVYFLTSRYGLGDEGVQDLVYQGITKTIHENANMQLEWAQADNIDQARIQVKEWLNVGNIPQTQQNVSKQIIILADDMFYDIFCDTIKPDSFTDILALETVEASVDSLYTRYISPYAACFLASRLINYASRDTFIINILAPNPLNHYVSDAVYGYRDGILTNVSETGTSLDISSEATITFVTNPEGYSEPFLSGELYNGFASDNAAFTWCNSGFSDAVGFSTFYLFDSDERDQIEESRYIYSKSAAAARSKSSDGDESDDYDDDQDDDAEVYHFEHFMMIPIAGYTNTGVYQFCETMNHCAFNSSKAYYHLVAMDKTPSLGSPLLTVVRRYDLVVQDFLERWVNGDSQERNEISLYGKYEYLQVNSAAGASDMLYSESFYQTSKSNAISHEKKLFNIN